MYPAFPLIHVYTTTYIYIHVFTTHPYMCGNIDAAVEFDVAVGADDLVAWRKLAAVLGGIGARVRPEGCSPLLCPICTVVRGPSGVTPYH